MSNTFVLQGMDKFTFGISEPYSAPHSLLFSLILARDMVLESPEDDDPMLSSEAEFRAAASAIQQQYLFGSLDRTATLLIVREYLHLHPDVRMEQAVDFASRPENQPSIEGFDIPPSTTHAASAKKAAEAKKRKKKLAALSKRRNRNR